MGRRWPWNDGWGDIILVFVDIVAIVQIRDFSFSCSKLVIIIDANGNLISIKLEYSKVIISEIKVKV